MNKQDLNYSYDRLHLEQLREEADQERLANQLPRKPGLLETALNRLFNGKQSD